MSDYSEVAAAQLDELESSAADDFWDAIFDTCELALNYPDEAQKHSTAVVTESGSAVFRLPVAGFPPYKVFWARRSEGPRVEAVFPQP